MPFNFLISLKLFFDIFGLRPVTQLMLFIMKSFSTEIILAIAYYLLQSMAKAELNVFSLCAVRHMILNENPSIIKVMYNKEFQSKSTNVTNIFQYLFNMDGIPIEIKTYDETKSSQLNRAQNYSSITLLLMSDNNESTINATVSNVDGQKERKHLNKFIVLFDQVFNESVEWKKMMFQMFWGKKILEVIAVYTDDKGDHMTTYDPFSPNGIHNYDLKSNNEATTYLHSTKPYNLNRFEINFVMTEWPLRVVKRTDNNRSGYVGIDGNLAQLVEEKLVKNSFDENCKILSLLIFFNFS